MRRAVSYNAKYENITLKVPLLRYFKCSGGPVCFDWFTAYNVCWK